MLSSTRARDANSLLPLRVVIVDRRKQIQGGSKILVYHCIAVRNQKCEPRGVSSAKFTYLNAANSRPGTEDL